MDIFFSDPNETPLPPEQVRIRELRVDPMPDGRRLRVYLEVDRFQFDQRPNADLTITDSQGQEVASTSVIGSMTRKIELMMHLRGVQAGGRFTLHATLFYAVIREHSDPDQGIEAIENTVVDTAQTTFDIPAQLPG
ncbi:MAG: hypothetical protein JXA78_16235 [Anaerolineales bacterium]|nr:hypothetical protein [Anaerolineales bacterium]